MCVSQHELTFDHRKIGFAVDSSENKQSLLWKFFLQYQQEKNLKILVLLENFQKAIKKIVLGLSETVIGWSTITQSFCSTEWNYAETMQTRQFSSEASK